MSETKVPLKTLSGIALAESYSAAVVPREPSGEFPYTRGIHGDMYRGRLWTMRQYAGFASAVEANKRFRLLLERGSTGLSIAFDLPTQMGRDADHPLAQGEVGKVGVAISSIEDMERLLDGVPLEKVSISMTINTTAIILLGFLLVIAERRGIPWAAVRGTTQNDILKEYVARGTYAFPPVHGVRLSADVMEFCAAHVPNWNSISVSGYHMREAGSSAADEVAFTIGNAVEYLAVLSRRGVSVDAVAPRLAFFFNCHIDFLEEIAKFRAARRVWATVARDQLGAKDPRSWQLRFHTQTAGSSLTAQQPLNNIVRTTIEALAAVLGGTQSLHTNSFDEALGLPSEQSATVALRTQQIIAFESGAAGTVDPLGGSHAIEALTDTIEATVRARLSEIAGWGGMLAAIDQGHPQRIIERSAYEYQRAVESGDRTVVGVNAFTDGGAGDTPIERPNPEAERRQVAQLAEFRAARDGAALTRQLHSVTEAARGKMNTFPAVLDAIRVGATLGEISDCFRAVFGEY